VTAALGYASQNDSELRSFERGRSLRRGRRNLPRDGSSEGEGIHSVDALVSADSRKRRSSILHKRRDSALSEVGGLFARQEEDEREIMCDIVEKMTHAADLSWHRRNAR
jgi:hypothetical protein